MAKQLFAISLFLFSNFAIARNGFNYRIHHEYQSLRALGMGDAFVAIANDYSGLLYNPAALARRDDGQINLYMDFGFSQDIGTFFGDITEASNNNSNAQTAVLNVLQDAYGKNFAGRMSLPDGIWVRPGWGVAVIPLDFTMNLDVHQQGLGPGINAAGIVDTTVAYGWARDFYVFDSGRTSAGFTIKGVNRGYFNKFVTAIDIASNPNIVSNSDLSEGMTIDADLGALYTPEMPTEGLFSVLRLARPSFGAVVRNVFDYGFKMETNFFNKDKNTEDPERLYRRIDLGSRWEYPDFLIFGGRGALDIRDILHPQFTLKKGLHLGLEFDWTMFSWWRGQYRVGLNQGYLTAGFSALFSVFNFDFVTYSEDIGTRNKSIESRKYEMRFNIDI